MPTDPQSPHPRSPSPSPAPAVPSVSPHNHSGHKNARLSKLLGEATANRPDPEEESSWRGVFFDGPESDLDDEGEEIPVWYVYVGNGNADPVEVVHKCFTYAAGREHARHLAQSRKLELIQEASRA